MVAYTILVLVGSIFTYRQQAEYRNGKSLLAISILAVLALIALLLAIAQVRAILPSRNSNFTLFLAIFLLTMAVWQLAFPYKSQQGRGWQIYRVSLGIFAVVMAISVVVMYIYNMLRIFPLTKRIYHKETP